MERKKNHMKERYGGKKVIAYYPDWEAYQEEKLQYEILTHVIYAFAIPQKDGTVKELNHPEHARELIQKAHLCEVKVLLAIGGWSYNDIPLEGAFAEATDSPEKRERFADEIMATCLEYGFDGIDIDWEHPRIDGKSGKQYQSLMLILAEKLHAQGKLLTSAVISGIKAEGDIYYDAPAHTDVVLEAVDWINIMAYDGGEGELHSSYPFATACGDYWKNTRKMPAEKVVLGVPFYARPGWQAYKNIISEVPDAWKKDHCTYEGTEVWYNGINTIKAKAKYAKQELGGIMIWELSQDTIGEYSLLQAIGAAMR